MNNDFVRGIKSFRPPYSTTCTLKIVRGGGGNKNILYIYKNIWISNLWHKNILEG